MRMSVVVWPDPAASTAANEKRAVYDAQYRLIGPHITVAFPDERRSAMDEMRAQVASAAAKTEPFTATLDTWRSIDDLLMSHEAETRYLVERYPNAVNAIFLMANQGATEMIRLRRDLSTAITQPPLLTDYPPYMCVGQSLSDQAYEEARRQLAGYQPALTFAVKSIDLLEEQPDGSWSVAATFALGR